MRGHFPRGLGKGGGRKDQNQSTTHRGEKRNTSAENEKNIFEQLQRLRTNKFAAICETLLMALWELEPPQVIK